MKTSEIPTCPKLKNNNYIPCLPDKIRIILTEGIIEPFITRSILLDISKELKLEISTLKKYLTMKKYPIFFIKKLKHKVRMENFYELIENNSPLFFSKWKKVKLPSYLTPKIAYFVGYLQGDGSIESNKKRINFCDECLSQINRINQLSLELFGVKGRIEEKRTPLSKKAMYRLEIGSSVINSYLHNIFMVNRGIKTNLRIPKEFSGDKEILKWYIIGLFDADGTLPKNPNTAKQLFIDITFKDKCFIEQIKEALEVFGIVTLNPYCRIAKSPNSDYISRTWELRIRKKQDIISFLKKVGFSHPDKRLRAEKLLKYVHQ